MNHKKNDTDKKINVNIRIDEDVYILLKDYTKQKEISNISKFIENIIKKEIL